MVVWLYEVILIFLISLLVSSCICTSNIECNEFSPEEKAWLPYSNKDTLIFKSSNGGQIRFECSISGYQEGQKKKGLYLYSCNDACEKLLSCYFFPVTNSSDSISQYYLGNISLCYNSSDGHNVLGIDGDSKVLNSNEMSDSTIVLNGKNYSVLKMSAGGFNNYYRTIYINRGLGVIRMDLKSNEILERILL